jgi:hypothetical protein
MAKDKSKKKGKKDKSGKSSKKQQRAKERAEKREARKGDGTFPDILVVTREKDKNEGAKDKHWFLGHGEDLDTLYKNGQVVAVYKLRRVSTVTINRKVAR